MSYRPDKIISGGQTGADIGGLVAAERVGIPTGGTAPKGFYTEAGRQPILRDRFGLTEHKSPKMAPRTAANVKNSDATLLYSQDATSIGTVFTAELCMKNDKKCSGAIDPFHRNALKETIAFLEQHKPAILNVAGNRESKAPGIAKQVADILSEALKALNTEQ